MVTASYRMDGVFFERLRSRFARAGSPPLSSRRPRAREGPAGVADSTVVGRVEEDLIIGVGTG